MEKKMITAELEFIVSEIRRANEMGLQGKAIFNVEYREHVKEFEEDYFCFYYTPRMDEELI